MSRVGPVNPGGVSLRHAIGELVCALRRAHGEARPELRDEIFLVLACPRCGKEP